MISLEISIFIFSFCLLSLIFSNILSTKHFLLLCGFFISLFYPGFQVGVNLFIFQMIAPIAIFFNLNKIGSAKKRAKGLVYFIVYATILTLIWFVFDLLILERYKELINLGLGDAQTFYKLPVQLFSLMASLFAFYIPQLKSRNFDDIMSVERGFIIGAGFSFCIGILLVFTTGVGYIAEEGKGLIKMVGVSIPRIGGLSGEPKMLGAVLVLLLLLSFSKIIYSENNKEKIRNIKVAIFFSVGLISTLSTSAWFGFIVGLIVLFVPLPEKLSRKKTSHRFIVMGILVFVGFLVFRFDAASEVIEKRFIDRIYGEKNEIRGSKDKLVFDVFRSAPMFLLTGFGAGGFDLAAVKEYTTNPEFKLNLQYIRTPTPSAIGLRLLGDFGLIGIFLLYTAIFKTIRRCFLSNSIQEGRFLFASSIALLFISFNAIAVFSLLWGCAVARINFIEKTRSHSEPVHL